MKSYIDWSKVPDGFNFVALDSPDHPMAIACGIDHPVGAYASRPDTNKSHTSGKGWGIDPRKHKDTRSMLLGDDVFIGPLPDWRKSLVERPNE